MNTGSSVSYRMFLEAFPDEQTCSSYMFHHVKASWLRQIDCPGNCRWRPTHVPEQFRCEACQSIETAKSGTPYENSRLPVRIIFYAMLLLCEINGGTSRRFLNRQLGISVNDGLHLINSLRTHVALLVSPRTLGGEGKQVLIDESVFRLRRKERAVVLGLFDRDGLVLKIIPDVRGETLIPAIESVVAKGSVLVTDGWQGYNRLAERGWKHIAIRHGTGSLNDAHGNSTAPIEAVWRSLKEQLAGARGRLSREALAAYISQFVFILNGKKTDSPCFWRLVSSHYFPLFFT